MKRIQVLGPGCPKCEQLAANAQAAVRALGIEATVERVTDVAAIVELGAWMTPGLVIDGQLKLVGVVPSVEEIAGYLQQ